MGPTTTPLPSIQEVHTALRRYYKFDRFEGRDQDPSWGPDYSRCVATSHKQDLERFGCIRISRHESATGKAVTLDSQLREAAR